ncbi:flagellar basal-body rod protein FlgF [Uliginosibacterium sp. H1]|uniref:flagellar basal-body rod protein FlgF n=1 Tax=Uliginosibacterium sp. H1 TaxID=3114757 RepID=UPI002E17D901|nr:flagellar basal-body rod protein FlgF [Uliginosibacterium sp. H1]
MDRLIYTAMTGAKATMGQQAAVAHNLANVSTTGFRAELHKLRAVPVQTQALPSRAFVVDASVASDFKAGPMMPTGNPLDMAIQGQGWFAVRTPDGQEAYTRDGSFTLDATGQLRTRDGSVVLGDGGPITIPPENSLVVGPDGSITATPDSGLRNTAEQVGRFKLVNPPLDQLQRGDDGLFRLPDNQVAPADPTVSMAQGYLEGSNVSIVEQMVTMISLARNFDMHTKMLTTAQENDRAATQIISAA